MPPRRSDPKPHLGPTTGPFYVEGAEPGDTLAVHFVSIEPSRDWAASMDTPEMRAGTTCYLGVNVEGALFSLGDGHCRQGEGETCGVAVEAAMDTVLVLDLVKGAATPWPRLETDTHIMTAGSARPLEDAFRIAQADLIQWLAADFRLDALDGYQFVTQASETPVANVCDPNYTVVSKLRKQYLPERTVYGGMHGRVRELGRALLAERG
ncbi:MAG TPA: acetamidase/formamidase family protein [Actinomycetota bacterium]|nr:acetamidase/formamidase family protein [Actinomycetota bacterium]